MDYKAIFDQKYQGLNNEQRQAVDHIDGPLMVVAGPGTGKTQLLAMRVANILRQTDVDPSNILCLTFTESAAANMVERLSTIIGSDAYRVAIHTFHSFGSWIMGHYSEYFYHGVDFKPASPLTQAEIIHDILAKLPYDNPLRASMNGEFAYLKPLQKTIQNFKKAALKPDEARQILAQNAEFCQAITPAINEWLASGKMTAASVDTASQLIEAAHIIAESQPQLPFTDEPKLATLFALDLTDAVSEANELDGRSKTRPLTQFKNNWLKKAADKSFILKDAERTAKMQTAADVYEKYLQIMQERGLYDFDDMILNVINTANSNNELKANLQEQYQYILVDEFQDTNDAQMRLLDTLSDFDNSPNLMVVGDDDQAIYRFQGADISNIQTFARKYPSLVQINLNKNYRSGEDVLTASKNVATAITSRLKNVDGTDKQLFAMNNVACDISHVVCGTAEHEFSYVSGKVKHLIDQGEQPSDIAIIARQHASLETMSLYLAKNQIPINYERKRDIFRSELVNLIINLARVIDGIAQGAPNNINPYLPEILASPAFGISSDDFYRLSLKAHRDYSRWFETMDSFSDQTKQIADWLKDMAEQAKIKSLRVMLDQLIGVRSIETNENADDNTADGQAFTEGRGDKAYSSPIFDYYLDSTKFHENGLVYLTFLGDLTALTSQLKDFQPDQDLKLADLLSFVDKNIELGQSIYSTVSYGDDNSVQLMSAHKAKGLEFKTVFIIDAESEQWGSHKRSPGDKLSLPTNMPYGIAGDNDDDERRRILFVAMTRAKQNLYITSHTSNGGKDLQALEYLLDMPKTTLPEPDLTETISNVETSFLERMTDLDASKRQLLANRLDNYHLSATDLNSFTDVVNGGPDKFLLYNLLRVPQQSSGALTFGNAIHKVMERTHNFVNANNGQLPDMNAIIAEFHKDFDTVDLDEDEAKVYIDKGENALKTYFRERGSEFNTRQKAETGLKAVLDGNIRLTGKIDAMEIDNKNMTIQVVDYKTGQPVDDLTRSHGGDYAKIKARHYSQQLMFYKLLIENSAEYHNYRVISGRLEFVEPDKKTGQIICPAVDYTDTVAMNEFKELLQSVWNHIMRLDLPDISGYPLKPQGIIDFENWLRENQ